ncbi:hypothetical protein TKK_0010737 [Trichogramma kaykai]
MQFYFIVGQCWASTDANAASTGLNVGPVLVGYWNDNSKSVLAASIMPVLTQYQVPVSKKYFFFNAGSTLVSSTGPRL